MCDKFQEGYFHRIFYYVRRLARLATQAVVLFKSFFKVYLLLCILQDADLLLLELFHHAMDIMIECIKVLFFCVLKFLF